MTATPPDAATLSEREITRAAGSIGGATLLSRFLGLARDMLFAAMFGTTYVADAFNLAFLLPNTLRLALGEGAARSAFVPVYAETLARDGEGRALQLAGRTVAVWSLTLGAVSVAGILFADPMVRLYAPGWRDQPEALALAIALTRFLFPFILLAGITAVLSGFLNAHHIYGIPALAPVALNVGFIAFTVACLPFTHGDEHREIWAFAAGAMVGGASQILVQLPSLRRVRFSWRHAPSFNDPGVKRMGFLLVPALLGLAVFQLNTFVDSILATRLGEGSVTALRLANRVMLMPQGVVGLAVATAALPTLAALAATKDWPRLRGVVGFSLRAGFGSMAPAALGLVLLAEPVVRLLFERGEFRADQSTPLTAGALVAFAVGLPAFGATKALSQAFFALQDTRTPFLVGIVCMVANIALNFALMGPLGVAGLALATSLAGYLDLLLLAAVFARRVGWPHPFRSMLAPARVLAIAGAATGAGAWAHHILFVPGSGAGGEFLPVTVALGLAMGLYAGLAWLVRADEVTLLWASYLRRKRSRGPGGAGG